MSCSCTTRTAARPAVLIAPGSTKPVSAASVINRAKAAAHQAAEAFLRAHYTVKARFSRVSTTLPDVTHWWLDQRGVAFLDDEEYKLHFRARYGLLQLNAHRPHANRQARCCAFCHAHGNPVLETLAHVFSACPRYMNVMRLRHDAVADLVIKGVLAALTAEGARDGRYTVLREATLGSVVRAPLPDEQTLLRPDAFLFDNDRNTVTPIEFTVPDDVRLLEAVRAKIDKYAPILRRAAPRPPMTQFLPLAVVAVGAWGTVHPSAVNSLVRLGIPPDAVPALLKKAAKITARHAVIIARCRFAAARRNMPRAV